MLSDTRPCPSCVCSTIVPLTASLTTPVYEHSLTTPPPPLAGGQVKISRKGVPRVVWERRKASDDPDKPPTVDFIPFLTVSRSLGDFWSWCERMQQFVVSPHPDVGVHPLDPTHQKFIVLASDGLWDVMSPQDVVDFVWVHVSVRCPYKICDLRVTTWGPCIEVQVVNLRFRARIGDGQRGVHFAPNQLIHAVYCSPCLWPYIT